VRDALRESMRSLVQDGAGLDRSNSMIDPLTLVPVAGVLLVVGLLAAVHPVCRATRLDPVAALRYE
jgi:ABC-type antimicrobial peptide transport system permease subunit